MAKKEQLSGDSSPFCNDGAVSFHKQLTTMRSPNVFRSRITPSLSSAARGLGATGHRVEFDLTKTYSTREPQAFGKD